MIQKEKRYNALCNAALDYQKGYIHQTEFLNQFSSFILWKLNAAVNPYINRICKDYERAYINGK